MSVNNKAVQRGFSIALAVILTIVCAWVIAIAGIRLIGITPYAVISGSMEPNIPVGSMVYVTPSDTGEYAVGDVVTYKSAAGAHVTHRVVEVNNTDRSVIVKGDANENVDAAPVPLASIVGKTIFSVPGMGYIYAWFDEHRIMIIAGMIAIVIGLASASMFFGAAAAQEAADKESEEESIVNSLPKTVVAPAPTPAASVVTTPASVSLAVPQTCAVAAAEVVAKTKADEEKEAYEQRLREMEKRIEEMERAERERKIYETAYAQGLADASKHVEKHEEKPVEKPVEKTVEKSVKKSA